MELQHESAGLRKRFLIIYYLGLAAPFLCHLMKFFLPSFTESIENVLRPQLLCVLAVAVTGLWVTGSSPRLKPRADKFLLIAAYLWIFISLLLHEGKLGHAEYILPRAAIAWVAFYGFAFLLTEDEIKSGIRLVSFIWGGGMTVLALAGILLVMNRTVVRDMQFGLLEFGRMCLGTHPTTGAENLLIAEMLIAIAALTARRRWTIIPAVIAECILFTGIALTDGRNGIISTGIFAGLLAFALILRILPGKKILAFLAAAASAVLCVILIYFGALLVQKPFPGDYTREVYLRDIVMEQVLRRNPSEAEAPETQQAEQSSTDANEAPSETDEIQTEAKEAQSATSISHREIDTGLNGRTVIWRTALGILANNEEHILLIGATPYADMQELADKYYDGTPRITYHLHSIYLQVLMDWGIPGFTIMVLFLILFAAASVRLIFSQTAPYWQRILPSTAIVLLTAELVDAFTSFRMDNLALYVLFLFMGLTVSQSRRLPR